VTLIDGPEALPLVAQVAEAQGIEFCVSLRLDPHMVAATCSHGYMPMAMELAGRELLLIKCHEERCVLDFENLHTSASTLRRARGLSLEIDRDFRGCLESIVEAYPDRWLVSGLCESLEALNETPLLGVQCHSVEVYERGELVAGEVGYSSGAVYSSLSGFHRRSGAGSVQLACLALILERAGFAFWDLGMEIEYKIRMGARTLQRDAFLERCRRARDGSAALAVGPWGCERLLRSARPGGAGRA
jgi:leucyl/phenylalanyl-tRNA--protein transferase